CHLEKRRLPAAAALVRCAIMISIAALEKPAIRIGAIRTIKARHRGQHAVQRQLEQGALITDSASDSRAVEIAIMAQDQLGMWIETRGVERDQRSQDTVGRHFEHSSFI